MKKRCSQDRTRAARSQRVIKMLDSARAARSDHRNANGVRDRAREFDIVTVARAIAIHARQEYLASAEFFGAPRPFDRIKIHPTSTTMRVDFPTALLPFVRVNCDDNALASERLRTGFDQFRILDGSGVQSDLVSAGTEYRPNVFN